jgi:hypothetical protein
VAAVNIETFVAVRNAVDAAGFGDEVAWSENCAPAETPEDFAAEAIFVVCNGGMKNTVARRIYDRVLPRVQAGGSAGEVFGNKLKARAIDRIWRDRLDIFLDYQLIAADEDRLAFLGRLPHIGPITKYHLAKNFGVDVAKPDVHLQRLADHYGETVQGLCERLGAAAGLKARTVDVVLWRACAVGIINSKTGEVRL